ncbi:hypothetical protein NW759_010599 [Fusarium solani]|nr:hypothetical protein NW759_010599 [Fusarium solani]
MTEIFGAVSGAISIAALFNDCVDCFEYIQLARHFGKDYSRCQLRLDVAKWRLDRWAPLSISITTLDSGPVSRRYEQSTPEQNRVALTLADLDPASQQLRNEFQTITKKRQDRASLVKKTGWALYDKKRLGNLIDNIVTSIDELELVFPSVAQASMDLARAEIQKVGDQQSLHLIRDAADGLDPVLNDLAKQKLAGVEVQNFAARVRTTESGKFEVGNIFTKEASGQSVGFPYRNTNRVEDMEVKGDSGVHVGDTYGGKGFWG